MFAELKSKEDIQKAIVEYLGEGEKDIRRIEFSKIYDKIPISFFLTMVILQLTTKLNTTMILKCVFFIVVGLLYLKFYSNTFKKNLNATLEYITDAVLQSVKRS